MSYEQTVQSEMKSQTASERTLHTIMHNLDRCFGDNSRLDITTLPDETKVARVLMPSIAKTAFAGLTKFVGKRGNLYGVELHRGDNRATLWQVNSSTLMVATNVLVEGGSEVRGHSNQTEELARVTELLASGTHGESIYDGSQLPGKNPKAIGFILETLQFKPEAFLLAEGEHGYDA